MDGRPHEGGFHPPTGLWTACFSEGQAIRSQGMMPRWFHRLWACLTGYFWLPCPRCGQMFAGYEIGGNKLVEGHLMACCWLCQERDWPRQ
jgi:hypothetical protein